MKVSRIVRYFGPGFVTGSADNDPSGIGTYSIAGTRYGLSMLWLCPLLFPLMFVIQEMCARIGLASMQGLAKNLKVHFSKNIVATLAALLLIANTVNIGANLSIMAEALTLVTGINMSLLAIVIAIIMVLMEIFISYRVYSKWLLVLTSFLLAYVATAFMVTNQWQNVLWHTFVPSFTLSRDFIIVLTGFFGTTITPYLFFWQTSHEIEEHKKQYGNTQLAPHLKQSLIRKMRGETLLGMFFSQLISFFIIVTCFSTLHVHGITEITSAADAALTLRPFAGQWAYLLFTFGIIGSGFLGTPVIAGSSAYALSELFDMQEGLSHTLKNALFFYGVIIVSVGIGLGIHFIGINPIRSLLYAAVINGIVAIPLIAFIILLANKSTMMGVHKNKRSTNIIAWTVFTIMFFNAILTIYFF